MLPRLLAWLRHRRLPFHVFDWNQVPSRHVPPPSLLVVNGARFSWSNNNVPLPLQMTLRCLLDRSQVEGFPVCGLCFGMQSMMTLYGGLVGPSREGFVRRPDLITLESGLAPTPLWGYRNHSDVVQRVAPGFRVLARSRFGEVMAVRSDDPTKRWIGFQFHPEAYEESWFLLDNVWKELCTKNTTERFSRLVA